MRCDSRCLQSGRDRSRDDERSLRKRSSNKASHSRKERPKRGDEEEAVGAVVCQCWRRRMYAVEQPGASKLQGSSSWRGGQKHECPASDEAFVDWTVLTLGKKIQGCDWLKLGLGVGRHSRSCSAKQLLPRAGIHPIESSPTQNDRAPRQQVRLLGIFNIPFWPAVIQSPLADLVFEDY